MIVERAQRGSRREFDVDCDAEGTRWARLILALIGYVAFHEDASAVVG